MTSCIANDVIIILVLPKIIWVLSKNSLVKKCNFYSNCFTGIHCITLDSEKCQD